MRESDSKRPGGKAQIRVERLARALRGNLKRRKAVEDAGPDAVLRRDEAISAKISRARRPNCDENGN